MKMTISPSKRIKLLRDTKLIIEKSLAACTAELRSLEATVEPELFPVPVSSPYAVWTHKSHRQLDQ